MALTLIRGGAELEHITPGEMTELLDMRERRRARGLKIMEFAAPLTSSPASVITVGPAEGYTWAVRLVSSTLATAGTLTVYKTSSQPGTNTSSQDTRRLVAFNGTSQTAQAVQLPSDTCMLQHGTALLLVASTNLTNYYLAGWEAIAERQWMLMD